MGVLWWIWLIPLIGIIGLYLRSHMKYRAVRRELAYINMKLEEFTDIRVPLTHENLLAVTGEPELRRLLQAINALLDRARQSASDYTRTEREMRMMLSNVSHDLKTPLTVIMGYAEMLDRNPELSQDERQHMFNQVHQKTIEVHDLIHSFFDLTKLEADDFDLPLSMINVCEVCRKRILTYFDLLAEREFQVDIHLPEEPVWVYANEEALSRIMDNLLSNAVRYGADGRFLGLTLTTTEGNVKIEVIDRGRGIAKVEQSRVFERMYTMEDSRNRNMQGSGLGLAIAKKLTERLGGRIDLDSVPGIRTCFTVTLQLPLSAAPTNLRNK
jgi:signal transduction histidine kinase